MSNLDKFTNYIYKFFDLYYNYILKHTNYEMKLLLEVKENDLWLGLINKDGQMLEPYLSLSFSEKEKNILIYTVINFIYMVFGQHKLYINNNEISDTIMFRYFMVRINNQEILNNLYANMDEYSKIKDNNKLNSLKYKARVKRIRKDDILMLEAKMNLEKCFFSSIDK